MNAADPPSVTTGLYVFTGVVVAVVVGAVIVGGTPTRLLLTAVAGAVAVASLTALAVLGFRRGRGGIFFAGMSINAFLAFALARDRPSAAPLVMILLFMPAALWAIVGLARLRDRPS